MVKNPNIPKTPDKKTLMQELAEEKKKREENEKKHKKELANLNKELATINAYLEEFKKEKEKEIYKDAMEEDKMRTLKNQDHAKALAEDKIRDRGKDRVADQDEALKQAMDEDDMREWSKDRVFNREEARKQAIEEDKAWKRDKERVADPEEARKQAMEEDNLKEWDKERVANREEARKQAMEENKIWEQSKNRVADPEKARKQAIKEDVLREREKDRVVDSEEARIQAMEEERIRELGRDRVTDPEEARIQAIEEDERREPLPLKELASLVNSNRTILVNAEKALREARKNRTGDSGILELAFEKAEDEYRKSVARYARAMYAEKVKYLESQGLHKGDPAYETALARMKCDIFNNTVVYEQDALAKEKYDSLEPRKRTWFRRMLEGYNKWPTWKKVLVGSGVVTGAVLTGGGIGWGAAALFGAGKFVRGLIGAKVGVFTGGLVKSIFGRRVEQYRTDQLARQSESFGTSMEGLHSADDWGSAIAEQNRQYETTVREVNRRHRNITLWAAGAGIAAGGLAAWAAGPTFEHSGYGLKPDVPQMAPSHEPGSSTYIPDQSGPKISETKIDTTPPITPELEQTATATPPTPEQTAPITPTPEQPAPIAPTPEPGNPPITMESSSGISPEAVKDWALRNYEITGLRDNMTIGEVVNPEFVRGTPEAGSAAFDELNNRIAFRNEVMHLINLRESRVSSMLPELRNASLLEMLRQRL